MSKKLKTGALNQYGAECTHYCDSQKKCRTERVNDIDCLLAKHAVFLSAVDLQSVVSVPQYKTHKFRDWLLTGVTLDIKPNMFGLEVLSYLAYETVAQVRTAAEFVKRSNCIS